MAFGRKGAPIGNKNAAGNHRGGTVRRLAVGAAKAVGYTAAVGVGTVGAAVGTGMFLQNQLEKATGVRKASTKSFNKGGSKKKS